jgi:hypothetical protein
MPVRNGNLPQHIAGTDRALRPLLRVVAELVAPQKGPDAFLVYDESIDDRA